MYYLLIAEWYILHKDPRYDKKWAEAKRFHFVIKRNSNSPGLSLKREPKFLPIDDFVAAIYGKYYLFWYLIDAE